MQLDQWEFRECQDTLEELDIQEFREALVIKDHKETGVQMVYQELRDHKDQLDVKESKEKPEMLE